MKLLSIFMAAQILLGTVSAYRQQIIDKQGTVTMSFTGDCMVASMYGASNSGNFNWYAQNNEPEYFLKNVADVFEGDDLTIVNCENVLTDKPLTERDKGEGTSFWFRGPTSNAKIFSSSGVEVAGVANNHANDYGSQGFTDTVEALESEGLTVLKSGEPVYIEKNGVIISILACGIWYEGSEDSVIKALKTMTEKSDIQIIYPHGGAEGTHEVEAWRKNVFRKLIDSGADLVVAHHAHVLQPVEEYHGGIIVYGLGNFCYGGSNFPENRTAIFSVTAKRTDEGFTFTGKVIPCYVFTGASNNWQPALMEEDDENYKKIIDFMAGLTASPG